MKRRIALSTSLAVAMIVASCGGTNTGAAAAAFSGQLDGVCRTIGSGIGNLDAPASLDDVGSNATDTSTLFENGINDLKRLTIPSGDKQFAADVRDLIAGFEDQLDTLDAIAKAARQSDQAAVDAKIDALTAQVADSNNLADSLEIEHCQLDPAFTAATLTTAPDVPLVLPIATVPADTTRPADNVPIETTPIAGDKQILTSTDIVPLGDYTFADAPDTAITGFQTLLELAPSMAAQSGRISGIDVIDSDGQAMGRVFTFESDTDPLSPGSFEEATPFFTGDTPTTPKTIGTLDGLTWSDPDGTVHFLVGVSNVVLWALSPSAELLDPTLQAWGESVSQ